MVSENLKNQSLFEMFSLLIFERNICYVEIEINMGHGIANGQRVGLRLCTSQVPT